jgi:glycosyltransferase involved in cell wall biosynthesis
MRVVLVTHRYPPDGLAGVERYTQTLAAELVKAGDAVAVVTRRPLASPPQPETVREQLPDGTTVYRLAGGRVLLNRFLVHHERLEQLFEAALAEAAPDVVHFNHLKDLSPRFVEIARRRGAAVVISLHDFYFACPLVHLQKRGSGELCPGPDGGRNCADTCFAEEAHHPWIKSLLRGAGPALRWERRTTYFRQLLLTAERVISGSRYVASFFEQFAPGLGRLRVIPNGVADDEVGPVLGADTPQAGGALNLVYFGTVVPHKGPHVILEALRVAGLGPVTLAVLGPIPHQEYERELRRRAAEVPGLKFWLYGAFKRRELRYLLQDTDCVVVPSLVPEAGPLVPREALARGIPVAVARLGALPETVAEGENGLTFDPHRPGELAALLRRLAHEEGLLNRLRDGARRAPVVTVSGHAEAVRSAYREALEERALGRAAGGADDPELLSLHSALLDLGFGTADPTDGDVLIA